MNDLDRVMKNLREVTAALKAGKQVKSEETIGSSLVVFVLMIAGLVMTTGILWTLGTEVGHPIPLRSCLLLSLVLNLSVKIPWLRSKAREAHEAKGNGEVESRIVAWGANFLVIGMTWALLFVIARIWT